MHSRFEGSNAFYLMLDALIDQTYMYPIGPDLHDAWVNTLRHYWPLLSDEDREAFRGAATTAQLKVLAEVVL
jgi:hypothetical protein